MKRLAIALSVLFLLACGGSESGEGIGDETPPVSAIGERDSAGTGIGSPAGGEAAGATRSAEAQSCIDLVAAGKFAQAVPVCTAALREAPEDAELRAAADRARTQAAQMADSADAAAGAAAEQAGAAAGTMPKDAGSVPKFPSTDTE